MPCVFELWRCCTLVHLATLLATARPEVGYGVAPSELLVMALGSGAFESSCVWFATVLAEWIRKSLYGPTESNFNGCPHTSWRASVLAALGNPRDLVGHSEHFWEQCGMGPTGILLLWHRDVGHFVTLPTSETHAHTYAEEWAGLPSDMTLESEGTTTKARIRAVEA